MTSLRTSGMASARRSRMRRFAATTRKATWPPPRRAWCRQASNCSAPRRAHRSDGIVSDRKVSAGDTAQIGKELVKVIDPRSLRFEGLVSADSIGEVRTGAARGPARERLRRAGFPRQDRAA